MDFENSVSRLVQYIVVDNILLLLLLFPSMISSENSFFSPKIIQA